jgi:diguanylate cyclase
MTSAQVPPSANPAAQLSESIVDEARGAALPLAPKHFEFWHSYKSGRNATLRAAADEIKAKHGTLTAQNVEALYERYLSPWRMSEGGDSLAARLADELDQVAISLDGAIGSALAQRETMAAETSELSIISAVTLQGLLQAVDRLMQSTKEGQTRFTLVEAKLAAACREIAALQQQLNVVRAECQSDPLTSLPTRGAFDATLAKAIARFVETRQPLAIMFCDIDYFASFNENFGVFAGNDALRAIGVLLKGHVRAADMVARFGSDEFGVIMQDASMQDAIEHAERFRQALMSHEFAKGPNGEGRITVSLGVADGIKGDTPEYITRRAANGLKVAKSEGRNRVVEMTLEGPVWTANRRA